MNFTNKFSINIKIIHVHVHGIHNYNVNVYVTFYTFICYPGNLVSVLTCIYKMISSELFEAKALVAKCIVYNKTKSTHYRLIMFEIFTMPYKEHLIRVHVHVCSSVCTCTCTCMCNCLLVCKCVTHSDSVCK